MGPMKLAALAWRNLWRQRRRTLLTLSAIVFGFFLSIMFTATQDRSFADMIDTAARNGYGHVTVQHEARAEQHSPEQREQPARDADHLDIVARRAAEGECPT